MSPIRKVNFKLCGFEVEELLAYQNNESINKLSLSDHKDSYWSTLIEEIFKDFEERNIVTEKEMIK